jgi:hypothetical protein
VIVQKYRNGKPYQEPFRLSGERVFESDYRIRLVFSSPQPGYIYILNEGPNSTQQNPAFNTLFPSPLNNGGSARLNAGQELKIPEGGPLVFDTQRGTEKLWLIWSKVGLAEIEALRRWVNFRDRGMIGDVAQLRALQSFLAKHAKTPPMAEQDEVNQTTILKGRGDVLAHLLKLEHD